jgi:hypothetical protein
MEFLSPKILNMSFGRYKAVFTECYEDGPMAGEVRSQRNIDALIKLISPYVFQSELVIDVAKHTVDYSYENENEREYNKIKEKYLDKIEEGKMSFFAMSTELQHCYTRSKARDRMIQDLVSDSGEQFIIYVKYLDNIKGEHRITSKESLKERRKIIEQFSIREFNELYLTYGCGSFGLNLQFCRNIVFADQLFDYAQKIQAGDRIYRMGQEAESVNYYNFWCDCGMETIIKRSLVKKSTLLREIKARIKSVGNAEFIKEL